MQPHGVAAARGRVALGVGMKEVEHAALADHGVVIDVLLQPFPELHRPFVEWDISRQQVIGPNDRGVAPDIAAAEIPLLHHRDIRDAVLPGQVIGGRQSVSAAADNDDVICGFGLASRQTGFQPR